MSKTGAAFKRAREAIRKAAETGATKLNLSIDAGFGALENLPEDIAGLTALQSLDLEGTPVTDLTPLTGLTALQSLDLRGTQVTDLTPLARLTALQSLDLFNTQVTDLTPLLGLAALQSLNLRNTQVSDITHLTGLTALQSLELSKTQVTDIAPLVGLTALQNLELVNTKVSDIAPLAGLTALQHLELVKTKVSDIAPLAGLTALQNLDLWDTPVTDLTPLAGLTALQSLNLSDTQVTDLAPLRDLPSLNGVGTTTTAFGEVVNGLFFDNIPATQSDPELARLSEIWDDAERTQATLAYLRESAVPDDPQIEEPQTRAAIRFHTTDTGQIDSLDTPAPPTEDEEIAEIHGELREMATKFLHRVGTSNTQGILCATLEKYLKRLGVTSDDMSSAALLWPSGRALKTILDGDANKVEGREDVGEAPKLSSEHRAELSALWEYHLIFTETVPALAELNRKNLDPVYGAKGLSAASITSALREGAALIAASPVVTETAASDIAMTAADAQRDGPEAQRSQTFAVETQINFFRQLVTTVIKGPGAELGKAVIAVTVANAMAGRPVLAPDVIESIKTAAGLLVTLKPQIQVLLAASMESTSALQSALQSLWTRYGR